MVDRMRRVCGALITLVFACGAITTVNAGQESGTPIITSSDPRDDQSPWGVASGAEWLSAYPVFNPRLKDAGVHWLRGFYEWQDLQPAPAYWNFAAADHLVANARLNGIHLTAGFNYLARWASADGGTRRFPIKDMQFWRDYVGRLVERYHQDIKYWEVWNEFDGGFAENASPKIYADLVREASISAKAVDPDAKIGLSVANFDVSFLDAAIKAGAAGYFDYICVHPYEKLNTLEEDGEVNFLSMTTTIREMLKSDNQSLNTPLWISEIGAQTSAAPDEKSDRRQAILLTKAYVLSIAAGFEKTFWFEARGPIYGSGTDHGLLRSDFSPRPSYAALKTLTNVLGSRPKSAGWLDLNGSYGFLFQTDRGFVMSAWAPRTHDITIAFDSDVQISDLTGHIALLRAGDALTLTDEPRLVSNVSAALVGRAAVNQGKPYPWKRVLASAPIVSERLQGVNQDNGIQQIKVSTTTSGDGPDGTWRKPDFSRSDGEGHYIYFAVDPSYVPFGTRNVEITAVVRRLAPDKLAGMQLNYESQQGYVDGGYLNIPAGDDWQEIKWRISDANFVGGWGWNFRLNAISSPNEFLIKEIRARRLN